MNLEQFVQLVGKYPFNCILIVVLFYWTCKGIIELVSFFIKKKEITYEPVTKLGTDDVETFLYDNSISYERKNIGNDIWVCSVNDEDNDDGLTIQTIKGDYESAEWTMKTAINTARAKNQTF